MIKLVTFSGYDNRTGPHIFPIEPDVERTIGHIKMARPLPPKIEQYIRQAKPIPGKTQLLIDAMGAGEYYGCFPAGTLITTDQGEIPIEQVTPKTMVLTHLNRYRPVRALLPQPARELCDLHIQGLPSTVPALTATPNHELWVVLRDDFIRAKRKHIWKADTSTPVAQRREVSLREVPFSWVPISELRAGDMVAEPFPLDEDPAALGDEKWNRPEVAFLMGLYASEGCVARRYGRSDANEIASIIYVTGSHKPALIERAVGCAEALGHTLSPKDQEDHATRMQLAFKELAELCLEHIGTPAPQKRLSQAILRMPRGWQQMFFEGYAGGDGCIRGEGKEEGCVRCTSASAGLLRDMRLMLARQGIAASVNGRHNTKATWYAGNPIFELSISASQFGGRGIAKSYIHPDGYILSSVKKTETYEWSGEVYDLSVEEDTSYTASGVSVHNSNVNGDFFPEEALRHEGAEYGHQTFMHYAYPYKHHVNKDPARAYGDKVTLADYDPHMHRVLLIVRVDDSKCQDILGDLAGGHYWDVSMGCKVPWDECSICKNRARTRAEYCPHLRYQMNKILQDGRRVFAYNWKPKFFDISFVTIGAEKASHVLRKVAQARETLAKAPSAALGELYYGKLAAAEKRALQKKRATITKEVPSEPAPTAQGITSVDKAKVQSFMDAAGDVKATEPSIPNRILDRVAQFPTQEIFSTIARLGIDLKPHEFQRIILVKEGQTKMANQLERHRLVFDERYPASRLPSWASQIPRISNDHLNEKVALALKPYLASRCCLPEPLALRIDRMEKQGGIPAYDMNSQWYSMTDAEKAQASGMPGAAKAGMALAAGYVALKAAFPKVLSEGPAPLRALSKYPWLLPILLGAGVGAIVGAQAENEPLPLRKYGAFPGVDANTTSPYHHPKVAGVGLAAAMGTIPLAYIYSGIQQRRWEQGEKLNALNRFIAENPHKASIGLMASAPFASKVLSGIGKKASTLGDMSMYMLGSGTKLMPALMAGAAIDSAIFRAIHRVATKKKKEGPKPWQP